MRCQPSKPCPQACNCALRVSRTGSRIDGTKALINRVCFLFVDKRHPTAQKAAA